MKITVYKASDEFNTDLNRFYLAHMELAPNLTMPFFGATREAAIERANAWYAAERERQLRLEPSRAEHQPSQPVTDAVKSLSGGVGRGGIGTVWMVNKAGQRARVPLTEISLYESNGYVRGGPRTKV